jgi:Tol biopolymer transport system component
MQLLRRNNGPAGLSRYWNALIDGRPSTEIDRLGANLDPDVRDLAGRIHRTRLQTVPDTAFAERLHQSLLAGFREAPPSLAQGVSIPGWIGSERSVAAPGRSAHPPMFHRFAQLAAAMLILMVIAAGIFLLLPDNHEMSRQPVQSPVASPAASPVAAAGAGVGINIASADGSLVLNLSPDGAYEIDPAWSPDGMQIVFSTGAAIWVMNADGSDRRLIADTPSRGLRPRWSPDGTRIAFLDKSGQLYLVNVDGSGLVAVKLPVSAGTPAPISFASVIPGEINWVPAWSPDGKHVAVFSGATGFSSLYVVTADGSQVEQLADGLGGPAGPVWSPDGTSIAFIAQSSAGVSGLFVLTVENGEMTTLLEGQFLDPPAWSPDGSSLLIGNSAPGGGTIVNADGTGSTPFTALPNGVKSPIWSPEGDQIAFLGMEGEVYLMNADGTELRRLAEFRGNGQPPAWSPDGEWLVFSSQG